MILDGKLKATGPERKGGRALLEDDDEANSVNLDNSTGNATENSSPVVEWRRSAVTWEQESGSLKFFILEDLPVGEALRVTVTLVNREVAQTARLAQVNVCSNSKQLDVDSRLLASNVVSIFLPASPVAQEETGAEGDAVRSVGTGGTYAMSGKRQLLQEEGVDGGRGVHYLSM
jgi:hypothetical protein